MKQDSATSLKRNRFILLSLQGFLLGAIGLFIVAMLTYPSWKMRWETYRYELPFNSADWKANAKDINELWPTRLRMENNLLQSGVLKEKTQAEILELLGPPPSPWDRHEIKQKPGRLIYYLGPQRGHMRIDCEFLEIYFDSRNQVEKYVIWND